MPNDMKITMKEIAKRCGVSKTTVSLAFSHHPRISADTRKKIFDVATEMGYSPAANNAARRLALQKYGRRMINRAVAVFVDHQYPSMPYFSQIVQGIMDVLAVKGFGLFMHYIPGMTEEENQTPLSPLFDRGDIDGVIGMHHSFRDVMHLLRENPGFGDRPIVNLMNTLESASLVRSDDQQGAYQAIRHLLGLGHRHILLFTFIDTTDARGAARIAGAEQAMREADLDPAEYLHCLPHYPGWLNVGTAQALHFKRNHITPQAIDKTHPFIQYLQKHPQITAVLAANDACAINAWQVLHTADIAVPEQLSLIGFDDTVVTLDPSRAVHLTTMHVPLKEIGMAAAKMLLARITGDAPVDSEVALPVTFVERNSTAPPCR